MIVAATHDRASVNMVPIRTVKVLHRPLFDVGCFSYALDHVGENMKTPVLDKFGFQCLTIVLRSGWYGHPLPDCLPHLIHPLGGGASMKLFSKFMIHLMMYQYSFRM